MIDVIYVEAGVIDISRLIRCWDDGIVGGWRRAELTLVICVVDGEAAALQGERGG